jgi:DNA-binding MarR family transcriptional regulator
MSTPNASLARAVHGLIAGSVAAHEAVAERLGINSTDLRCLVLASREPGLQPTRLAELAGLTTGAITGVLDRLERAGFVRREPDPADRRRLRVRLVADRVGEIEGYYEPLLERAQQLTEAWEPTAREHVAEYVESFAAALREEAARLRVATRGGLVGNVYTAPLADIDRARLVYASGAPRLAFGGAALGQQVRVVAETAATRLRLRSGAGAAELVRAVFDGPAPDVRASGGALTMRYGRRLIDVRSRLADVALSASPTWAIEVDGGVTDLDGDLRTVRLESLEVRGGANHIRLNLGRPEGTTRIVLAGGTSDAHFERPRGVAMALQVRDGVSHLRFDGNRTESVSGALRLQTDGYGAAAERFEIELRGGASVVTFEAV